MASHIDPQLERLGAELSRTGHTVVPHGDHLCVRLPFFASVRIRVTNGVLRCEQRFGLMSRDLAVFGGTGLLATVTAGAFALRGIDPVSFALAFVSVLAAMTDVIRVTVSEAATTRVQLLHAMLHGSVSHDLSDAGPTMMLPVSAPPEAGLDDLARRREATRTPAL